MLDKEEVLKTIQNIISEPLKRDGGPRKEIKILKAIEEMEDRNEEVVICKNCIYYHPEEGENTGICDYHKGQCYPDDYCSFSVKKN